MREVLYVQAGSLSNFVGTHFWNAQESYFSYDNDDEEPIINHDISFREGVSAKGQETYCPRVLIFDAKANFGSLSATTGLYEDDSVEKLEESWPGDVVEYHQDNIPKSQYHTDLENESFEKETDEEKPTIKDSCVCYWSDYSRAYYHPRSIHKLSDNADWESLDGNWTAGKETFTRYNQDATLMDDSFRMFAEECDSIQGMQVINDAASFGSFIDSFISDFRDDFVKLPVVNFIVLSEPKTDEIDFDDPLRIRKAVNDAMCIRSMNDTSTLNVPILPPRFWSAGAAFDLDSTFQSAALLSANLETALVPTRLRRNAEDFPSICAQLNWRGNTRFAHLGGKLPVVHPAEFDHPLDFSTLVDNKKPSCYSRRDVTRGLSSVQTAKYNQSLATSPLREPFLSSTHTLAYPMPSSFPSHVLEATTLTPYEPKGIFSRSRPLSMVSSLATTSATASLFSNYATFIEKCVKRKTDTGTGVEFDDLKDLTNELWTLHDDYVDGEHDEDFYVDGGMGEDD